MCVIRNNRAMYFAYGVVNVVGRDIVDVGAFVGDMALYFVSRGRT
jgi:hypothetical protein